MFLHSLSTFFLFRVLRSCAKGLSRFTPSTKPLFLEVGARMRIVCLVGLSVVALTEAVLQELFRIVAMQDFVCSSLTCVMCHVAPPSYISVSEACGLAHELAAMAERSSAMDGESIARLFLDFCKVHKVVSKEESRICAKLCEVGKAFLLQRAKALVAGAEGRAVLLTYGSDSTPLLCKQTFTAALDSHHRVVRKAGRQVEFLVERAFLCTVSPAGEKHTTCVLTDPTPLDKGKTAWCEFSAACRFFPLVRMLDHRGIVVSHYVFDRALQSSLSRKMQQRHGLYYEVSGGPSPRQGDIALQELLDWIVNTPCAAHDCHNSLKWGLGWLVADETEVLKKVHIAIESLRNAYNLLHCYLKPFVAEALRFDEAVHDYHGVFEFWTTLCVDPAAADLLADMNLRWDGSQLLVSAKHRGKEGLIEQISSLLLSVFRFKQFTDSRWVTIGNCCRSVVASLSLGLQGLVSLIRNGTHASDWYIHGFAGLHGDALKYVIVAAFASHPCDSLLLNLLADDRLATKADKVEQLMAEELERVSSIGDFTFHRSALLLEGVSPTKLRSDIVQSASISTAYFTDRALNSAKAYPWRLCSGDINATITALADAADPPATDSTTKKIWQLARLRWNRALLVDGIKRLGEVRWTTAAIEQGHGSVAVMHRTHSEYGADMLSQRAFVHMLRALFADPQAEAEASNMRRINAQLQTAGAKQPQRITGRHVFLADYLDSIKQSVVAEKRAELGKRAMSRHARVYSLLPPDVVLQYEARALRMVEERSQRRANRMVSLWGKRLERSGNASKTDVLGHEPLSVSECRFTHKDFDTLAAMWNTEAFSQRAVNALRAKAMESPVPPSASLIAKLESIPYDRGLELGPLPAWCRGVCYFRKEFANCALVFDTDGDEKAYAFQFARLNPMTAVFRPLVQVGRVLPAVDCTDFAAMLNAAFDVPKHAFKRLWVTSVSEQDIVTTASTNIYVVPGLLTHGKDELWSHCSRVSLEDYVAGQVPDGEPQPKRARTEVAAASQDHVVAHPWIRRYLGDAEEANAGSSSGASSSNAQADVSAADMNDEERDAVFAALEAKRREWGQLCVAPPENFTTSIRGGAYVKAFTGMDYDNVIGSAKGASAIAWCKKYFHVFTASFAFRKYGEEVAPELALCWCERMEYFYSIYISMNSPPDYQYTADDVRGAPGHAQILAKFEGLLANDAARERLSELADLIPMC